MTTAIHPVANFSPPEIRFRKFRIVKRGFDPEEVADFLAAVAEELSRRDDEISSLQTQAAQLRTENSSMRGLVVEEPQPPLDPAAGHQLERGQVAAEAVLDQAKMEARSIVRDARKRAAVMWDQAERAAGVGIVAVAEKQRLRPGDLAADIRTKAENIERAARQIELIREQFTSQLNEVVVAAQDAQVKLLASDTDITAEHSLLAGDPE